MSKNIAPPSSVEVRFVNSQSSIKNGEFPFFIFGKNLPMIAPPLKRELKSMNFDLLTVKFDPL